VVSALSERALSAQNAIMGGGFEKQSRSDNGISHNGCSFKGQNLVNNSIMGGGFHQIGIIEI